MGSVSGAEWLRQVSMEGGAALVKTASIRERAGSARALQILQEEEEEERRLSLELAEVQEEIAALAVAEPASADPGWQTKKKKKRKRRRRKGSAGTPAAEAPTAAASAAAAAEEGTRAALVHTRSQIADLARVLSRPAGAAAATAEQAALARTRSQIAALRSTLSLDAAAEAAAAASAAAEGLSEEQQLEAQLARLGKRVAQIRPDGDCLFSSVADQLRRVGARQPAALPGCYVC